MRTVLELPDELGEAYLKALEHYGLESSRMFLRRCALALVRHADAGDKLTLPLDFNVARNPKQH
jgi:hypothetical protein